MTHEANRHKKLAKKRKRFKDYQKKKNLNTPRAQMPVSKKNRIPKKARKKLRELEQQLIINDLSKVTVTN